MSEILGAMLNELSAARKVARDRLNEARRNIDSMSRLPGCDPSDEEICRMADDELRRTLETL